MSVIIKKHKKNLFFLVLYKRESYKTIAHFTFRMKQPLQELDSFLIWMGRSACKIIPKGKTTTRTKKNPKTPKNRTK